MAASQIVHPSRAVIRTVFAAIVAFAGIFPAIVDAAHLPQVAGVTAAIAVAAAITRVLALPQVEFFLQTYLPWLSASPANAASEVAVPEEATYEPEESPAGNMGTPDTSPADVPAPE